MEVGKFELYRDKGGQFRFRLQADNGDNLGTSEGYPSKNDALEGIVSVKVNAHEKDRYAFKKKKNGKIYFVLKGQNGKIVFGSPGYTSQVSAKVGAMSVLKAAPDASVCGL